MDAPEELSRHCEERSDVAISNRLMPRHEIAALRSPRCARNDELIRNFLTF